MQWYGDIFIFMALENTCRLLFPWRKFWPHCTAACGDCSLLWAGTTQQRLSLQYNRSRKVFISDYCPQHKFSQFTQFTNGFPIIHVTSRIQSSSVWGTTASLIMQRVPTDCPVVPLIVSACSVVAKSARFLLRGCCLREHYVHVAVRRQISFRWTWMMIRFSQHTNVNSIFEEIIRWSGDCLSVFLIIAFISRFQA